MRFHSIVNFALDCGRSHCFFQTHHSICQWLSKNAGVCNTCSTSLESNAHTCTYQKFLFVTAMMKKTWFLNVSTKQNIFPYRAHYIEFKTTDNLFWQGCPDTLKWWGASLVFQPGDGVRTLFAICSQFNFTQENNKLSNKNVGANSLHPPLDLEPLFWRLYISHFSSEDYEK